jgi:hypothetical protein
LLLIKVEKKNFVFIYCTEQLNLKNISYWHYFMTKIMSICPIWNFTLNVTQSLHFFENHPNINHHWLPKSCLGCDRMVVWFITTYAISAYHHKHCKCRWFSLGTLVSSTNKTDSHYMTEILLKEALSTIKPNQTKNICWWKSRSWLQTGTTMQQF